MGALKDARQEKFCLLFVQGKTQTEAGLLAGYAPKAVRQVCSRLLTKANIKRRLAELREAATTNAIMSVRERKERLSEIARAKLTDFMQLGPDGSWVDIGPETEHSAAIQEIHSRTEYDDDGSKPTIYTSVKLHDPMRAIAELNKMDGIYSVGGDSDRPPLIANIQLIVNGAQVDIGQWRKQVIDGRIVESEKPNTNSHAALGSVGDTEQR